jgi:hypothetical protein
LYVLCHLNGYNATVNSPILRFTVRVDTKEILPFRVGHLTLKS